MLISFRTQPAAEGDRIVPVHVRARVIIPDKGTRFRLWMGCAPLRRVLRVTPPPRITVAIFGIHKHLILRIGDRVFGDGKPLDDVLTARGAAIVAGILQHYSTTEDFRPPEW